MGLGPVEAIVLDFFLICAGGGCVFDFFETNKLLPAIKKRQPKAVKGGCAIRR
jgi:hypothetical protein